MLTASTKCPARREFRGSRKKFRHGKSTKKDREEYEEGWKNLEKEDFQVDYILTHTAPRDVAAAMGYGELSDDEVELRQYLQRVADETEFQKWYFGHFHEDAEVEEVFVCLYDEVVELS